MALTDPLGVALATESDRQISRALVVLTRAALRREESASAARRSLDRHLPALVRRAVAGDPGSDDGGELREALRDAVILLRPRGGAVAVVDDDFPALTGSSLDLLTEVLMTAAVELHETTGAKDAPPTPTLAWIHGSLALAVSKRDERRKYAVRAGERSAAMYRELVARDGDTHLAELAAVVTNLAVSLDAEGRTAESRMACEEAVPLYRRLVDLDAVYRPQLAVSLMNLANSLSKDGQQEEALVLVDEAVEIRRALVDVDTDERGRLAAALREQSYLRAALGRRREALDAVNEAVRLCHESAATGPGNGRSDLASALHAQAIRLGDVGRSADALAASQDVVRIYRELAASAPAEHMTALARALHNMSIDLERVGHPAEEVLAASAEAAGIWRALVRTDPERFRPSLAQALDTMSGHLATVGQAGPALDAIAEVVAIRRVLFASDLDLHGPELADSLEDLSIRLAAAGRPAEALDPAREAVDVIRGLVDGEPDQFLPALASALGTLSMRLGDVDRDAEALVAVEEAVAIRRELAARLPAQFRPELARSLNNLSVQLSRAGRVEEALTANSEALRIRRDLARSDPDRYTTSLAMSLTNLAVDLSDVDRHTEALALLEEAVVIRVPLTAANPRAELPGLLISLGNLAYQLGRLGRRGEVLVHFDVLLTSHRDDDWTTGMLLLGRGSHHRWSGDLKAALADARDALDLLESDPVREAEARLLLRALREADPDRFDAAWDGARGEQPMGLRHIDPPMSAVELTHRWLKLRDVDAEETFLDNNPALLADEVEAVLEHLIDENPGHRGLRAHHHIIRLARQVGAHAAFAHHHDLLWRKAVTAALARWLDVPESRLRDVLADDDVLLTSDQGMRQAEDILAAAPRPPDVLWRIGLLALCRSDGTEAAFELAGDPEPRGAPPVRRAIAAFEPRHLAVARVHAGRTPQNPLVALAHGVIALVAGHADEADEAIARCAGLLTSWDRRNAAHLLTDLTSDRPDLANGLARLRSILGSPEGSRHHGDGTLS